MNKKDLKYEKMRHEIAACTSCNEEIMSKTTHDLVKNFNWISDLFKTDPSRYWEIWGQHSTQGTHVRSYKRMYQLLTKLKK